MSTYKLMANGEWMEGEYNDVDIAKDTAMEYFAVDKLGILPNDTIVVYELADDGETWVPEGSRWTAADFQ